MIYVTALTKKIQVSHLWL